MKVILPWEQYQLKHVFLKHGWRIEIAEIVNHTIQMLYRSSNCKILGSK